MRLRNLFILFAVVGLLLPGFSSCSSDDDDDVIKKSIAGTWKISTLEAGVETNNEKATAAIKKSIEEFQLLEFMKLADLTFNAGDTFEAVLDMYPGEEDKSPVTLKGKYTFENDILSINKIESVDLGTLGELIESLPPGSIEGLTPEAIQNLPALANGFLPFKIIISNLSEKQSFTGTVPLTDIYKDPAKIASVLDEQKVTDVDPATVEVKKVEVVVKCVAVK